MKWFIKCIRNYVNFNGRARRKEYWNFTLFVFIFNLLFMFVDSAVGWSRFSVFSSLFSLFVFLPSLAVSVRRLHDTGRSGKGLVWFYIAAFVWFVSFLACLFLALGNLMVYPLALRALLWGTGGGLLVWAIFFLVWFCTDGHKGENKYGPDPKAE